MLKNFTNYKKSHNSLYLADDPNWTITLESGDLGVAVTSKPWRIYHRDRPVEGTFTSLADAKLFIERRIRDLQDFGITP